MSSEAQVALLSQSLGRAFRPQILRGDVRDAQFQMEFILSYIPDGRVRVLGSDFSPIYSIPDDSPSTCYRVAQVCWESLGRITYLHPIFYDDQSKSGVFGYLTLSLPVKKDVTLLLSFSAMILLSFVLHAVGLFSSLNEVFHNIHHAVMGWSLHLATNPKSSTEELGPPVFSEFEPMLSALRKLNSTIHKLEADAARHAREKARILRDAELSQLACQVAHDIRSPLGALKVLEHQFSGVPEEPLRLLRASIGRIRDITNNLLKKNREHLREAQAKPRELLQLIALVVSEKLVQYEASLGLDIHIEAVPVHATFFVAIHESEFKCMISNLLDNAIEAQAELPHVEIRVEAKGEDWVHIRIADHGSGIPADILSQLGERGATFGKEGGNGLGLYHARTWVECWGGSLEIGSQVSEGTRVSITLPRTKELQTGSTL